jgi:hypothetical protein
MNDPTTELGLALEEPRHSPANLSHDVMQADPTAVVPAGEAELTAETEAAAGPVIPIPFRMVSGRYVGTSGSFRVELRVDIDRAHSMHKVSGDFFTVSGATVTYFGSFVVNAPVITIAAGAITANGLGTFTFSAGAPVVQVTIPRRPIFQPAAPATLHFLTTSGGSGATYVCGFASAYFRTVRIETDRVSDVGTPVFSSYNTGALPSGGPARTLSVVRAYAEAGVEMIPTFGSDVIDIAEAGANHTWSDAELHASMVTHFSLFQNVPQWAVWQVVCQLHDLGPGLYGIMFDQLGPQRQGCAVFHAGIGGTTSDKLRLQLYTYVHELGHCFNLLHSWQKSFANPPAANRPSALSYMNYPWNYPGGPAAFWTAFPFQFDDPELIHLRHAFRNNIIMGGNPFVTGAAVIDPNVMADAEHDGSGLDFTIQPAHRAFALGEPVVCNMALRSHDKRGKMVQPYLHPKASMTSVAILKPNGQAVLYEPFMDHLMSSTEQFLGAEDVIEDSAYIGFGKGGHYFDQPGTYKLRAIYHAADGSQVMSNVVTLRVRHPVSAKEERLAELLMGEEQGALFWLLGSDSDSLAAGNAAFTEVLEKHGDDPLADYVRLTNGVNASRTFKTIDDRQPGRVRVRSAALGEAQTMLNTATAPGSRVDDLSKLMVLHLLEQAQRRGGDTGAADATKTQAGALRAARR